MQNYPIKQAALLALCLWSCGPTRSPDVALILHRDTETAALAQALGGLNPARFQRTVATDPAAALGPTSGLALAVLTTDALCTECYELTREGPRVTLRAGGPHGLQYGLTHWLESLGYGFFHPRHTREPEHFPAEPALTSGTFSPAITRRGLHLHTLHPIEPLFDFWMPSAAHLEGAQRTIDWLIRNRGNYLQWAALDQLVRDPSSVPARTAHTKAIIDYAHARGVEVGLTVQLFDKASLQQSFTLVDASQPDAEASTRARLTLITGGLKLDNLNLSFGEFFGADPQVLIDRIDTAYRLLQEVSPGTRMSAVIHVGDTPELRVDYAGRNQLYYFLVRYANPAIFPRVHTVMFYNLFGSAGGAYEHQDFSEHREFISERLTAGQPVGYYPEAAYWVAFDNAVPMYLARARFSWAVFAAAQAYNTGSPHQALLDVARAQLARGQRAAGKRRRSFHAPNGQQLISDGTNPTFYDYGYLRDANTLCFWRRELAQVRNLVEQAGVAVPGCVL